VTVAVTVNGEAPVVSISNVAVVIVMMAVTTGVAEVIRKGIKLTCLPAGRLVK
jgi:K+ transporter